MGAVWKQTDTGKISKEAAESDRELRLSTPAAS